MNEQTFLDQQLNKQNNILPDRVNELGLNLLRPAEILSQNNWSRLNFQATEPLPHNQHLVRSDRVEHSLIHKSVTRANPDATTADLRSSQPGLNRLNPASITEPPILAVASSNRHSFGIRNLKLPSRTPFDLHLCSVSRSL